MFSSIEENPSTEFFVNLEQQFIKNESTQSQFDFEIDAYKKMCLLEGLDDTDYVISQKEKIKAFERRQLIY